MPSEADKTTKFLKWMKYNLPETCVVECKISKSESIPFDAVKPHQESSLWQVKHSIFNYKIPDAGYDIKPFDLFQMKMENSYVCIFWYAKRGDNRISIIPIKSWCEEREKSDRKSLTFSRSCSIGRCLEL